MQPRHSNLLIIQTPEGIVFPLILAGPVTRFLAWSVDVGCIITLGLAVGIVLELFGWLNRDIAFAFVVLSYFIISIFYPVLTEWYWRGQTVGKRLLKLRVMDVQGLRLHFSQILVRNLLRFVDSLPFLYLVGGIVCWFNRNSQRLGDIAANTIVVRNPKILEPDLSQLLSGKFNSLREYPHLAARLRNHASPQEAGIALQALLRRDQLDPAARYELFQQIAAHFKLMTQFPSDATEGLTDEQYVRNVVDILFNKS